MVSRIFVVRWMLLVVCLRGDVVMLGGVCDCGLGIYTIKAI